ADSSSIGSPPGERQISRSASRSIPSGTSDSLWVSIIVTHKLSEVPEGIDLDADLLICLSPGGLPMEELSALVTPARLVGPDELRRAGRLRVLTDGKGIWVERLR
ncbi:hypothetical protein DRP77_01465, partial [Candidatus Poribacteria bacterium]